MVASWFTFPSQTLTSFFAPLLYLLFPIPSPSSVTLAQSVSLIHTHAVMSFYYNYTGPYPGTLRVNQANQPAPAKPADASTPWAWLAVLPKVEPAPTATPATPAAANHFVYLPRYDPVPAPEPKPAEPVNPWFAPQKASSLTHAHPFHSSGHEPKTDVCLVHYSLLSQRPPTSPSTTPVKPCPSLATFGTARPKLKWMLKMPPSLPALEFLPR